MKLQQGKESEPEDKAWPMMKGKAEGLAVKGKVRQWAGVGGTGKATTEEKKHHLHHTVEAYERDE